MANPFAEEYRNRITSQVILSITTNIRNREVEPTGTSGYTPRMTSTANIAFLGAGNMAEALIAGMLNAKRFTPSHIKAYDIVPGRLQHLKQTYRIDGCENNIEGVKWADVVMLCVKPQVLDHVISEIAQHISNVHLIISVAAGVPLSRIQAQIPAKPSYVRAMPNTPAVIRSGVTAITTWPDLTAEQRHMVQHIFESVGKVVSIDESLMDAVTGLSGSGPAYVYLIIEALTDGGVRVGLPRAVAHTLAVQTVLGAARMVDESGEHPALLKDRVTSPGGTTIAGIQQLEAGGLRATLIEAVEAATHRSLELGQ